MSCYCDFDGYPSVYRERWSTAKIVHKCCECGATIHPGNKYQYVSMVWDGDFLTYKTCERCADLRDALSEVTCPQFRGLQEDYFNYLDSTLPRERRDAVYRRVFPSTGLPK